MPWKHDDIKPLVVAAGLAIILIGFIVGHPAIGVIGIATIGVTMVI